MMFSLYEENKNKFWITCIYGKPQLHLRYEVWNKLKEFAAWVKDEKWIVRGDFNQILGPNDKYAIKYQNYLGVDQFRDCINSCKLLELPNKGQHYT